MKYAYIKILSLHIGMRYRQVHMWLKRNQFLVNGDWNFLPITVSNCYGINWSLLIPYSLIWYCGNIFYIWNLVLWTIVIRYLSQPTKKDFLSLLKQWQKEVFVMVNISTCSIIIQPKFLNGAFVCLSEEI